MTTNYGYAVRRHHLLNICVTIFSTVLSLVLIEIGFRIFVYYDDSKIFDAFIDASRSDNTIDLSKNIALREIIRHSSNRHIVYELIPNISVSFKNKLVRINSHVLAFTTYFPKVIKEILKELDSPMLEAGDAFTIFMAEHGIKQYVGSPLTVGDQDPHPSALGHTILADVLYNHLKDTGIVRDMVHKQRPN